MDRDREEIETLFIEVLAKYFNAESERIDLYTASRGTDADSEIEKTFLHSQVDNYKYKFKELLNRCSIIRFM